MNESSSPESERDLLQQLVPRVAKAELRLDQIARRLKGPAAVQANSDVLARFRKIERRLDQMELAHSDEPAARPNLGVDSQTAATPGPGFSRAHRRNARQHGRFALVRSRHSEPSTYGFRSLSVLRQEAPAC